jgi:hypothetical protein
MVGNRKGGEMGVIRERKGGENQKGKIRCSKREGKAKR